MEIERYSLILYRKMNQDQPSKEFHTTIPIEIHGNPPGNCESQLVSPKSRDG